jgi:5-(carboxyamino)imidazole ribonucleotide synthase
VSNRFPRVGIIGAGPLARMMIAPATALGVDLYLFANSSDDCAAQITHHRVGDLSNLEQVLAFAKECDLITVESDEVPISLIKGLEKEGIRVYPPSSSLTHSRAQCSSDTAQLSQGASEFDSEIAVMVARSPHGQAVSWTPSELLREDGVLALTVTPARHISSDIAAEAQRIALEIAQEIGLVGVMTVAIFVKGDELFIDKLVMRPDEAGNWTIEGSAISQFEQHLRAILDLPLGDPAMLHPYVVTGSVLGGEKTDMYRPYLHLMARTPQLHFHQYRNEVTAGVKIGHVSACGNELAYLIEEVNHARRYMSGEIDE